MVTLGENENKVKIKALIDTGNTISEETAITAELHKQLKVGFEKVGGKPIGTANKTGPKLENHGISNLIKMEIEGIDGKFQIKPAVVNSLTDPLNIGNGFLESVGKQLPVNIEFQGGNATLKIGQMCTKLIRQMNQEKVEKSDTKTEMEPPNSTSRDRGRTEKRVQRKKGRSSSQPLRRNQILSIKESVCKPNTITFLEVETARPMNGNTILVEDNFNLPVEIIEGIYSLKKSTSRIAVVNSKDKPVRIKKRTSLGFISEVEIDNEKVKKDVPEVTDSHRKQVIEDLGLMSNPVLKENPKIKKKVVELVMEYADIFGQQGQNEIGETDLVEFEIKLKEGTTPVKQKLRPLNPHQRKSLEKQIETWKREGIIEESTSPWASPLVPAKKAGGAPGEIRWATDFRQINAATITDSYPIPNIDEVLEKLAGSKYFSALDAAAAYHTIPVAKKSRPLLAFITPMGLYQFKRMPFGPTNSGATYARFVDMLLQRIRSEHIVAYIDDILLFNDDLESHLKLLREVFELHRIAGIKLRPKKTALFKEETKYLGFNVSKDGIRMSKSFVDKILSWPKPENTKELRTFLGFTSYYRSFIPEYSELTNEMNSNRMEKELKWDEKIQAKFEELKGKFRTMPLRSYPRYDIDEPFILTTDWSQKNMAGVLSQVQDGQERFIAAHGRKCSRHETNYPSTKGELAAVISCLRKWSHILKYKKFILYTDSKALKYLKTLKQPTGLWFRWLEELQDYDFEVKHKPGIENTNADNLSRSNHLPPPTEEEIEEGASEHSRNIQELEQIVAELDKDERVKEIKRIELSRKSIRRMHEFGGDISIPEIIRAQKTDPTVAEVRLWVENGRCPDKEELKGKNEELRRYAQVFEVLKLQQDVLYNVKRLNTTEEDVIRVVIPEELRDACFYWSHQHITAGHFSHDATVARAQMKFFYPGMYADLRQKVENCGDCLAKKKKLKIKDAEHHPQRTGHPGQRIYIDLVGPLPETSLKERYILTVEDGFTRYVSAYPIPNKEAATVARALFNEHCSKFGFPEGLHSDNGKEFCNEIWDQLCERIGIRKTTTPTYNPNSNIVERFHRTLNAMLRVVLERDDTEWARFLPAITLAFNTKVNASTGVTPYLATFGREAKLPVDFVIPTPQAESRTINNHVAEMIKRFKKIYAEIRKNNEAIIRRNANAYSGKQHDYDVGQRVWYLCPRKVRGKPAKLTDEWLGPYSIIRQVAQVLYEIEPADYEGPSITVHVARLLPYKQGATVKTRIPTGMDDRGDELAEEIRPPRLDTEVSVDIGVPVSLGVPEYDIVDIMANKKGGKSQRRESTRDAVAGPVQERSREEMETEEVRDEILTEEVSENQGKKRTREERSESETEKAGPSSKAGKLRQKRTWEDLQEQLRESRRRRELSTETETDQPQQKKLTKSKRLFMSSEDESDMNSLIRTIKVDITKESAIPEKGIEGSAAYDLKAHDNEVIPAHGVAMIPLNLKVAIPPGYFLLLLSRSGLAVKGIITLAGLVDSNYRGIVSAVLANSTDENFVIKKGQRCCQGVLLRTTEVEFNQVEKLDETNRNDKGFGSSGDF